MTKPQEELRRILERSREPGTDPGKICDELTAFAARQGITLDQLAYGDDAAGPEEFRAAFALLSQVLAPYDPRAYFLVNDNYGTRELLVEVVDPQMDWPGAKRAIATAFAANLPAWVVVVRAAGTPDERIGHSYD